MNITIYAASLDRYHIHKTEKMYIHVSVWCWSAISTCKFKNDILLKLIRSLLMFPTLYFSAGNNHANNVIALQREIIPWRSWQSTCKGSKTNVSPYSCLPTRNHNVAYWLTIRETKPLFDLQNHFFSKHFYFNADLPTFIPPEKHKI